MPQAHAKPPANGCILKAHERRRLAGVTLCEERTIMRWERGEQVRPRTRKLLEEHARKLGLPQDVDPTKPRFTFKDEQPAVVTVGEPPCWAIRIGEEWATGRNANGVMHQARTWWCRKLWQDKAKAMAEMWTLRADGHRGAKCIKVTRRTRSR